MRRILLGAQLRRHRESRGISREDAGYRIRGSESKISRMELGRVGFRERDVEDLLTLYGVTDDAEREALLALAREVNEPGWWYSYSDVLPSWFQSFVGLEAAAELIRMYEVQFVPGLLQTEEYARAVISQGFPDAPADVVERRVSVRMSRQKVLARADPPQLWMVVDEAALRRPIGGPKVMQRQLEHLIETAAQPNFILQVMPFRFGAHAAEGGAFSILRFREPDLPDMVYIEQLGGAMYLDQRYDVDHYMQAMNRLSVDSSTPADTIDILGRISGEMEVGARLGLLRNRGREAVGERPAEAAPEAPTESRWFVSAPTGVDLRPLLAALRRRGANPYILSDVAPLGAGILQSVRHAIDAAAHILVVLAGEADSLNAALEAGMAVALGKSVVVVADPRVAVPADFSDLLTVRARPDDVDAVDFALDQAEKRPATSTRPARATGRALGAGVDQLLGRTADIVTLTEPHAMERAAVDVIVRALEDSGVVAVQGTGSDRHFDVGVWSDDLASIAATPLLIEVKHTFSPRAVQQAVDRLHAASNVPVALLVYLDPASADPATLLRTARFPVLAISLSDLLGRMRASSFAEVVRDLQNESVHGVAT